ncbi:hypothetical protein JCM33374_g1937 [Metschnikowia sp. JCM 33374]|nr:hypothetical protein JCM33374_g1937 [Metschnikowia sp. JCM 33374]
MQEKYQEVLPKVWNNQEGLQPAVHVSARGYDAITDKLEVVEERLQTFIARLKSYILEPLFDIERFELEFTTLDKELADITRAAEKADPNKERSEKLTFAQSLFEIMIESTHHLEHFAFRGPSDEHLVSVMIELNLGILTLFDSEGRPDIQIDGFSQKVERCNIAVKTWKYEFGKLTAPSFGAQMMFKIQATRAERNLKILERGL